MPHLQLTADKPSVTTRVPLLPSVVSPPLPTPSPSLSSHRNSPHSNRLPKLKTPSHSTNSLTSLSVVNEETSSSSASDKTLTGGEEGEKVSVYNIMYCTCIVHVL